MYAKLAIPSCPANFLGSLEQNVCFSKFYLFCTCLKLFIGPMAILKSSLSVPLFKLNWSICTVQCIILLEQLQFRNVFSMYKWFCNFSHLPVSINISPKIDDCVFEAYRFVRLPTGKASLNSYFLIFFCYSYFLKKLPFFRVCRR